MPSIKSYMHKELLAVQRLNIYAGTFTCICTGVKYIYPSFHFKSPWEAGWTSLATYTHDILVRQLVQKTKIGTSKALWFTRDKLLKIGAIPGQWAIWNICHSFQLSVRWGKTWTFPVSSNRSSVLCFITLQLTYEDNYKCDTSYSRTWW